MDKTFNDYSIVTVEDTNYYTNNLRKCPDNTVVM
jgi:hypothetical protein